MQKNTVFFSILFLCSYIVASASHIAAPENVPGISSLFRFRPETAKPLRELAEILLVRALNTMSSLSRGECELIASYVSSLNQCVFCTLSHSAAAKHLLGGNEAIVAAVIEDYMSAPISERLKALLAIAAEVQKTGRAVSDESMAKARATGANDFDIHDTVLIAAAFCMYNRYVDGLRAWTPQDPELYDKMGKYLADNGYVNNRS